MATHPTPHSKNPPYFHFFFSFQFQFFSILFNSFQFFLPVGSRALAGERHLAVPGGVHFLAESEVGDLHFSLAIKQNIRGFQIVMNDPRVARAHVLQRGQHLDHNPARLGFFERAVLLEILFQVGSGTIFENGGEGIAVDDKTVELPNHVLVADSLDAVRR